MSKNHSGNIYDSILPKNDKIKKHQIFYHSLKLMALYFSNLQTAELTGGEEVPLPHESKQGHEADYLEILYKGLLPFAGFTSPQDETRQDMIKDLFKKVGPLKRLNTTSEQGIEKYFLENNKIINPDDYEIGTDNSSILSEIQERDETKLSFYTREKTILYKAWLNKGKLCYEEIKNIHYNSPLFSYKEKGREREEHQYNGELPVPYIMSRYYIYRIGLGNEEIFDKDYRDTSLPKKVRKITSKYKK